MNYKFEHNFIRFSSTRTPFNDMTLTLVIIGARSDSISKVGINAHTSFMIVYVCNVCNVYILHNVIACMLLLNN
jgi:hypothetical protein